MDEVDHNTGADFFGVYLLYCLNPRYKGRTYIGFTVDPNRRIKQHNGGVQKGGAYRTSGRGPWEMILIVHGFPSDIIALQFEWAWQNPEKSRRLRHILKKKAKEKGLEYRFRVLSAMLKVGPWNRLPLTIRWLKQEYRMDFDIDQQPPIHMPIVFGPLNKRKPRKTRQNTDNGSQLENADSKCVECASKIKVGEEWLSCLREGCSMKGHLTCLAQRFLHSSKEKFFCLPIEGQCPLCQETFLWRDLIKQSSQSEEQSLEKASSPHWADKLR